MSKLALTKCDERVSTTLGKLNGQRNRTVDPTKYPTQQFELYSVPIFPTREPEIIAGKEIGSNKQLVEPRSVLLCKINPRINRVWVVGDFTKHTKIASTEWIVFPPNESIHPEFLCYYLQQEFVRSFLASNASGVGGSLTRVKPSTIKDFPFSYPKSLDDQRRIVAEIETQFARLDAGVTALKRAQANLKRHRAAILHAACSGKLVPTEAELWRRKKEEGGTQNTPGANPDAAGGNSSFFIPPSSFEPASDLLRRILAERRASWSGRGKYKEPAAPDTSALQPLPEGWCWASLEQISRSSAYGTSAKCDYSYGGPPVLRIPNVSAGRIDLSDLKFANASEKIDEGGEVSPGDLLIIRTNGSKSLIGRASVIQQHLPQRTSYASYLIRFRLSNQQTVHSWVSCIWDAPFMRDWIEQRAATSAGQHNISMSTLSTLPVALPPLAEQRRIVAEVERRLSVLDELEAAVTTNLARAIRLRQAILHRAFSI